MKWRTYIGQSKPENKREGNQEDKIGYDLTLYASVEETGSSGTPTIDPDGSRKKLRVCVRKGVRNLRDNISSLRASEGASLTSFTVGTHTYFSRFYSLLSSIFTSWCEKESSITININQAEHVAMIQAIKIGYSYIGRKWDEVKDVGVAMCGAHFSYVLFSLVNALSAEDHQSYHICGKRILNAPSHCITPLSLFDVLFTSIVMEVIAEGLLTPVYNGTSIYTL